MFVEKCLTAICKNNIGKKSCSLLHQRKLTTFVCKGKQKKIKEST